MRLHVNECHLSLTKVCSSEETQREYTQKCATKLGMKVHLSNAHLHVALHYITLVFVFKKRRMLVALGFFNTTRKKGGKDERRKKAKLYFTSRLKGSLASHIQRFLG